MAYYLSDNFSNLTITVFASKIYDILTTYL